LLESNLNCIVSDGLAMNLTRNKGIYDRGGMRISSIIHPYNSASRSLIVAQIDAFQISLSCFKIHQTNWLPVWQWLKYLFFRIGATIRNHYFFLLLEIFVPISRFTAAAAAAMFFFASGIPKINRKIPSLSAHLNTTSISQSDPWSFNHPPFFTDERAPDGDPRSASLFNTEKRTQTIHPIYSYLDLSLMSLIVPIVFTLWSSISKRSINQLFCAIFTLFLSIPLYGIL